MNIRKITINAVVGTWLAILPQIAAAQDSTKYAYQDAITHLSNEESEDAKKVEQWEMHVARVAEQDAKKAEQ